MDQEEIKSKYKLCELEKYLQEIENVVQNAIQRENIKTANDNLNFLLYTLGKSIVTTREIIYFVGRDILTGRFHCREIYLNNLCTLHI